MSKIGCRLSRIELQNEQDMQQVKQDRGQNKKGRLQDKQAAG